jgi:putative ABC transport system substrate-binding protein
VDTIGESKLIDGLLSPNSARAPKTSDRWEDSFAIAPAKEVAEETTASKKSAKKEKLSETEKENKALVQTACNECDALYISAGSALTDQIEMITALTNENKVLTLGGDMTLGQHTLLTLYTDPYDMGYRAGKLVNRILVNEEDPGEIKISLPSSNVTKLYQDEIAEMFGLTFPKSFQEYDTFLETYEVGSNTNRVETEDTEE